MLKKRSSERASDRSVRFPSGTAVRSAGRPAGHVGSEHAGPCRWAVRSGEGHANAGIVSGRAWVLPFSSSDDPGAENDTPGRNGGLPRPVLLPVLPDVPVPFVRMREPLRRQPHGFCVSGLSARPDDASPDELFRPDPLVGRKSPFRGGGFSIPVLRAEIFGRRAGSLPSVASPYGRPVLLPDRRTASARYPGILCGRTIKNRPATRRACFRGGKLGIRTLGTTYAVQQISSLSRSTTPATFRGQR